MRPRLFTLRLLETLETSFRTCTPITNETVMQPSFFKPPSWLTFAQWNTLVSEAWQLGPDDAWRGLGMWTQPEENVDLTIIDYQCTFVELRICWRPFFSHSLPFRMTLTALIGEKLKGLLTWQLIWFFVVASLNLIFRLGIFLRMALFLVRSLKG